MPVYLCISLSGIECNNGDEGLKIYTMATLLVNPMPLFDADGANVAQKWKTWLADFKMYLIASNIMDKKHQCALLLYQAGQRVREIFCQLPDTGEDDAINTAVTKLTSYFEPQKNKLFEVYTFRKAVQGPNETLDQFHRHLRTLG